MTYALRKLEKVKTALFMLLLEGLAKAKLNPSIQTEYIEKLKKLYEDLFEPWTKEYDGLVDLLVRRETEREGK